VAIDAVERNALAAMAGLEDVANGDPPVRRADNAGWLHAPSPAHAVTAAVLRSGHLSRAGQPGDGSSLAVDLSSRRARLASSLLDGVRQGQPVGALLGYRFERALHERSDIRLDTFVRAFRDLAPLTAGKLTPRDGSSLEAVAASEVTDGLALLARVAVEPPDIPFGDGLLPDSGSPEEKAVLEILADIQEVADAVEDALLAESVHQSALGNPARAAASLDALSRGEAAPPELEVLRTPRTGTSVTNRVLLVAPAAAAGTKSWTRGATALRALADPHLDALAEALLPDPADVACGVRWLDDGGAELASGSIAISSLELCPLDLVMLPDAEPLGPDSEIVRRLRLYAADAGLPSGVPPDVAVELDPAAGKNVTLAELVEAARGLHDVFAGARPLEPRDLAPAGGPGEATSDATEMEARRAAVAKAVDAHAKALEGLSGGGASVDDLRNALLAAARMGVPGAAPETADSDASRLSLQAARVALELRGRQRRATAAAGSAAVALEAARAELKALLGRDLPAAPLVTPSAAGEVAASITSGHHLDGHPGAAGTWLARAARVRGGVARLEAAAAVTETLATDHKAFDQSCGPRVAQLPFSGPEPWVELPLLPGTEPPVRTSIVARGGEALAAGSAVCGLAVDEWTEVIPAPRETTGLSFHFDAPGACAPQAVLLAVPPQVGARWEWEGVVDTVDSALELAKLRAAGPDALGAAGHFLPAAYFAVNVLGDTAATDLLRAAGPTAADDLARSGPV
jgi:hypothetical protein